MLTPLEKAVLDMMLDQPGEPYEVVRRQLAHAKVVGRKFTGVGFFTDFIVPSEAAVQRNLPNMELSGVGAVFPNLKHGAGFLFFIRDGVIKMLEGYTYDEPWPEEVSEFQLSKHKAA